MDKIKKLPIMGIDLETKNILKQLNMTTRSLANLKGFSSTIPNKNMLINFMSLREAKASSEIEQIVTTNDKLYRAISNTKNTDPNTKEVLNYRGAMLCGFGLISEKHFMNINCWIKIQELIEGNSEGIRKNPGTKIENAVTKEIVWIPPQDYQEIMTYLDNLIMFVNDDTISDLDPLIKLALIHYQFEIIHPFYDGNGRTGRIINVLYLVLKNLLDSPILYLSGYILENKSTYYNLLNSLNNEDKMSYENWIIFILKAIEVTSNETNDVIHKIVDEMNNVHSLLQIHNNFPAKDLTDAIFYEVVTKIDYVAKELNVSRQTASNYLKLLENLGIMESYKDGRNKIYINKPLKRLITE